MCIGGENMNQISAKQMDKIKKDMLFYNFNELNSNDNSKMVVKFHDNIDSVIYSDLQFYEGKEMFEYKKNILIEFIKKSLNKIAEDSCIIVKYNEKWVVNKEKSKELSEVLSNYSVRNNFNGGILIDKKSKIVELFIESVLKYNSFIEIVFGNSQLIISPTDHMDIFFQARNIAEFKNIIIDIINEFGENVLACELDC